MLTVRASVIPEFILGFSTICVSIVTGKLIWGIIGLAVFIFAVGTALQNQLNELEDIIKKSKGGDQWKKH